MTELTTLLYVGGDGQEAMPGNSLPQTLRARVLNGQAPVIGAPVRFTVMQGGGSLSIAQPVATTSPDGIAECGWTLGNTGVQQVEAVLLDAGGTAVPGQILRFSANLSIASQVAYDPAKCSNLAGVKTVQDAIDILCQGRGGCCVCVGKGGDYERLDEALNDLIAKGERDICICLLHGDQDVEGIEIAAKTGRTRLAHRDRRLRPRQPGDPAQTGGTSATCTRLCCVILPSRSLSSWIQAPAHWLSTTVLRSA